MAWLHYRRKPLESFRSLPQLCPPQLASQQAWEAYLQDSSQFRLSPNHKCNSLPSNLEQLPMMQMRLSRRTTLIDLIRISPENL